MKTPLFRRLDKELRVRREALLKERGWAGSHKLHPSMVLCDRFRVLGKQRCLRRSGRMQLIDLALEGYLFDPRSTQARPKGLQARESLQEEPEHLAQIVELLAEHLPKEQAMLLSEVLGPMLEAEAAQRCTAKAAAAALHELQQSKLYATAEKWSRAHPRTSKGCTQAHLASLVHPTPLSAPSWATLLTGLKADKHRISSNDLRLLQLRKLISCGRVFLGEELGSRLIAFAAQRGLLHALPPLSVRPMLEI
eukprot:Skav235187  [mRNA]  locus=scaffold721:399249:411269:- [translate_table: standard]